MGFSLYVCGSICFFSFWTPSAKAASWPTVHRRATPRGLLAPHLCATSPKLSATFRREDRASALSFFLSPFAPSRSLVHHGRRVKLQRRHVSLLGSFAGQAKCATASAFAFSLGPRRCSTAPPPTACGRRSCSHAAATAAAASVVGPPQAAAGLAGLSLGRARTWASRAPAVRRRQGR
jgi:hypothetical protein